MFAQESEEVVEKEGKGEHEGRQVWRNPTRRWPGGRIFKVGAALVGIVKTIFQFMC